ncbi:MAG: DUF3253 domain-containing protein [Salinarimonadaceae bacterium]|nr:MAG: DUF3253 domain-containing protein [Salinarimonadaceae bacterium]
MNAPRINEAEIARIMRELVATRGPARTICPSEVARAMAGPDEKLWSRLMQPVRQAAVRLAKAGEVTIMRKGKPADPDDFRGVYRIGAGPEGGRDSD